MSSQNQGIILKADREVAGPEIRRVAIVQNHGSTSRALCDTQKSIFFVGGSISPGRKVGGNRASGPLPRYIQIGIPRRIQ